VRVKPFAAGSLGLALACLAGAASLVHSAPANPQAVDLELVLAADNSQSIDPTEARLQRQGVAAAFRHPEVVRAIQSGSLGRIAVAYLDWSSAPYTRLTLDWRIIRDKVSADAFADALLKAPPPFGQGTAIGEALGLAAQLIESNNIQGTERTIDVSGDGPNNRGRPVYSVRDEIVAKGITINGLPVTSTGDYGQGEWGIYYGDLENYYRNCVIGGARSFVLPAKGFEQFAEAIRHKLVLEISDAQPPRHPTGPEVMKVAANNPAPGPQRPPSAAGRGAAENCGAGGQQRGFRFRDF
jgi:hypothetical protein